uniref:Uncharacterized protein n=1 Tax=Arundo donax TaxID=35708 RepID=A0A0A8XUK1_ARUDO
MSAVYNMSIDLLCFNIILHCTYHISIFIYIYIYIYISKLVRRLGLLPLNCMVNGDGGVLIDPSTVQYNAYT